MRDAIRHLLTGFGQLVAHPIAFAIPLLYATLWFLWIGIVSTGTLWPHWPLYL